MSATACPGSTAISGPIRRHGTAEHSSVVSGARTASGRRRRARLCPLELHDAAAPTWRKGQSQATGDGDKFDHERRPRPRARYNAHMKAIISDIHGNLEALRAVLDDIQQQGADDIYCLGDLVGDGPDPSDCVDLAMQWKVVVMGNFDFAIGTDLVDFPEPAYSSLRWTANLLQERQRAYLAELPRTFEEGEFLFVHGSPCSPINEYIYPEHIHDDRIRRSFNVIKRYCFNGYTHIPGIFIEDAKFFSPDDIGDRYELTKTKTLVNVGSAGQPRDGDWRACYALLDGTNVRFRRIEYDLHTTLKKLYRIPNVGLFLGDRLRQGL